MTWWTRWKACLIRWRLILTHACTHMLTTNAHKHTHIYTDMHKVVHGTWMPSHPCNMTLPQPTHKHTLIKRSPLCRLVVNPPIHTHTHARTHTQSVYVWLTVHIVNRKRKVYLKALIDHFGSFFKPKTHRSAFIQLISPFTERSGDALVTSGTQRVGCWDETAVCACVYLRVPTVTAAPGRPRSCLLNTLPHKHTNVRTTLSGWAAVRDPPRGCFPGWEKREKGKRLERITHNNQPVAERQPHVEPCECADYPGSYSAHSCCMMNSVVVFMRKIFKG